VLTPDGALSRTACQGFFQEFYPTGFPLNSSLQTVWEWQWSGMPAPANGRGTKPKLANQRVRARHSEIRCVGVLRDRPRTALSGTVDTDKTGFKAIAEQKVRWPTVRSITAFGNTHRCQALGRHRPAYILDGRSTRSIPSRSVIAETASAWR